MKKSLVVLSLVASSLMADTFVGIDYGFGSYTASIEDDGSFLGSSDESFKKSPITLKYGFGKADNLSMDVFLKLGNQKFENSDASNFELGYKIRKSINIQQGDIFPFIQGGLLLGSTKTDFLIQQSNGSVEDSWSYYGLLLGGGVNYLVGDNIELILGADVSYNIYQPLQYSSSNSASLNRSDKGFEVYVGINFWLGNARSHDASYDEHADSLY